MLSELGNTQSHQFGIVCCTGKDQPGDIASIGSANLEQRHSGIIRSCGTIDSYRLGNTGQHTAAGDCQHTSGQNPNQVLTGGRIRISDCLKQTAGTGGFQIGHVEDGTQSRDGDVVPGTADVGDLPGDPLSSKLIPFNKTGKGSGNGVGAIVADQQQHIADAWGEIVDQ